MAKKVSKVVVSAKKIGKEVQVTFEDVLLACPVTEEELKQVDKVEFQKFSEGIVKYHRETGLFS